MKWNRQKWIWNNKNQSEIGKNEAKNAYEFKTYLKSTKINLKSKTLLKSTKRSCTWRLQNGSGVV